MRRATRYIVTALVVTGLGAPAIFFACAPGPTNFIDASDTPPEGLPVNPGVLTCGQEEGGCDTTQGYLGCCVGPGAEAGALCLEAGACPSGTGFVTCDETADCNVNPDGTPQACCATFRPDAGTMASQCDPSCAAATVQLCRTNGECPDKKCVVQKCPDGQTYEMCGLSTSASFHCTVVVQDGG